MSAPDPRATQLRACARCKKPSVACARVTQHMLNGILPIGRTYEHACRDCKATFETESAGRSVWNLCLGGLWFLCGAAGAAFVVAWAIDYASGQAELPTLTNAAISALMLGMLAAGIYLPFRSVLRFVNLTRNPVPKG